MAENRINKNPLGGQRGQDFQTVFFLSFIPATNAKVSKGRSADQTPIPCVPVASPGFKPKGRVCTNSGALKPDKLKLA